MFKRRSIVYIVAILVFYLVLIKNLNLFVHPQKPIMILYWTPMYDREDFYLGLGSNIFQKCTYSNCYATSNKTMLESDGDYDAIIFHWHNLNYNISTIPKNRKKNQIYIISNQETPINTPMIIFNQVPEGFYNWTMTYRYDSDIFRPYGLIKKQTSNYQPPSSESIKLRQKQTAWFVSHCETHGRREVLYDYLKDHLQIDVVGKCGTLSCPSNGETNCYKMLERKYKFYLSFENSLCNDYVTEKFFQILKYNVIPIVYGGANYDKIAPPNSFINVKNFKSFDDLIAHIKYLDQNTTEYLKYFEWKKHYRIDTSSQETLCQLCEKLNTNRGQTKIYKDIKKWWSGDEIKQCALPTIDRFVHKS